MKLPKRELKRQNELLELFKKEQLTEQEKDLIYQEFNPGLIDNLSKGVYFTPYGLAQDVALMAPKRGHILDLCAGIGMLSYRLKDMDSWEKNIKSLTCIELNPDFVDMGRKLLPEATWICGDVFDPDLIQRIIDEKGIERFDLIISNPPFGKLGRVSNDLNYNGNLDLMVLELCLKYAKSGYFILPAGSVPFKYSGERYYQEHRSRELNRFIKLTQHLNFNMSCDGIDCATYRDEWKNLNGINVEAVRVEILPWSLDEVTNAIKA